MKLKPFLPAEHAGDVAHFWTDENGGAVVSTQEIGAALDRNKAMRAHNDGYSPSREFRRVAHIPEVVRQHIINTEGWDPYRPDLYPEKMARLLNDSDYAHLRTADGRIGVTNGRMR